MRPVSLRTLKSAARKYARLAYRPATVETQNAYRFAAHDLAEAAYRYLLAIAPEVDAEFRREQAKRFRTTPPYKTKGGGR